MKFVDCETIPSPSVIIYLLHLFEYQKGTHLFVVPLHKNEPVRKPPGFNQLHKFHHQLHHHHNLNLEYYHQYLLDLLK